MSQNKTYTQWKYAVVDIIEDEGIEVCVVSESWLNVRKTINPNKDANLLPCLLTKESIW